jgi:hypothetical protein
MARAIDHLVLCVDDLERARAAYERLGFTTTPRAVHPWGTANFLVQLQGNFLELLTVADPSLIPPPAAGEFGFGAYNRDFLAHREGFSMLVLASGDARADQLAFARAGLDTYAPFDFSRQARLPDGGTATVSFSLAFVTERRMPETVFFVCQQHAPQYFWKPEFQRHANGALAIVEVVMVAERPGEFADFYRRLQGVDGVTVGGDSLRVAAGDGVVTVLTPATFAQRFGGAAIARAPMTPYLAAYRIAVADVARAAEVMTERGAHFIQDNGVIRVAPDDAFNVVIELTAR